jgi:hypothetical protein
MQSRPTFKIIPFIFLVELHSKLSRYLYTIKRIFGSSEELLIEILLNIGQASASDLIFQSANKLNKAIGI